MKLLPDYIIEYMPDVEDAVEELRLSVIDHAYELIQSLDIDELTANNIREKLALWDIKTENMSNEWLPNGRFYRIYAAINHHRTRLNTLKSIAKSGGQFEGLWSNEFKYKSAYNYRFIQIKRHYEEGSELDGYFYISGNTHRSIDGKILSSAKTALMNDIIMNQSLPAGYTYLYIPWPRPTYPDESNYFYQVHMLDYDRIVYEKDCDHHWISLSNLGENYKDVYYCPENSENNQYCKITNTAIKYGNDKDSCILDFDASANDSDREYFNIDSSFVPASTYYDWSLGSNTPWHTPYWFDYHYMNDMRHSHYTKKNRWPVREFGLYYAYDKYGERYVEDPEYSVDYVLDDSCTELASTKSVFPSKCNMHTRYVFTPPNRKAANIGIVGTYDEYQIIIKDIPADKDKFIAKAAELTGFSEKVITDKLSNLENSTEDNPIEVALKSYIDEKTADNIISELSSYVELIKRPMFNDDSDALNRFSDTYTQDELYHTNDSVDDPNDIKHIKYFAPYRHDVLLKRELHNRLFLNHFKQYKPFWNEKAPFVDMLQRERSHELEPADNKNQQNSLYNQFYLKQSENRIQLDGDIIEQHKEYVNGIVKDNKPPVSEVTFTSYDRPTRSHLDKIYIGYLKNDTNLAKGIVESQGENKIFHNDFLENTIYYYDEQTPIKYDPTVYYTLASLGYNSDANQYIDEQSLDYESSKYLKLFLYGNPATGGLYLNKESGVITPHSAYNYISYKASNVHKLWFNANHINTSLGNENTLYNKIGTTDLYHYTENSINLEYHIIGIYDQTGNKIEFDLSHINMYCVIFNYKYKLKFEIDGATDNINAAYVLFTVQRIPGVMDVIEVADTIETNMNVNHSGTTVAMISGKVNGVAKEN